MDDEQVEVTITVEPRLHNRWSLLVFAMAASSEMFQVAADNFNTLVMMTAQHAKQKNYDRKFKEIVK
jgi:hypothetical protein